MLHDKFAFQRGAVRPLVCLREGWRLVRDAYWLFLGISFVGYVIASMGPLGILIGPAFCGIHLCLLRHERGLPVTFDMLFNGFHYFVQGLVGSLFLYAAPMIAFVISYLVSVVCALFIAATLAEQAQHLHQDHTLVYVLGGVIGVLLIGTILIVLLAQVLFFFVFPLIVDRELSGLEAIKLSYHAARANLGGLLLLVLLTVLVDLAGEAMCFVGYFFVMPIHFAMVTIAYRQVFPPTDDNLIVPAPEPELELPPTPAVIDTGISAS